jgi:hypothetical protein
LKTQYSRNKKLLVLRYLKPTNFYYGTVSVSFFPQEILSRLSTNKHLQCTANPRGRGSEREMARFFLLRRRCAWEEEARERGKEGKKGERGKGKEGVRASYWTAPQ